MSSEGAFMTLGECVSLQRGTTYQSRLLGLPGPVLLGLASIARNGGFRSDSLRTYGGESDEKLLLRPGDLYVSLKDVTQSADLLGAVSRVPATVELGRLTQDTVKLTVLTNEIPSSYLYWILRTPQYRQYCRERAIGTTNLSLSRDDFLAFPIPRPTSQRLALVACLDALEDKIAVNERIATTADELIRARYLHVGQNCTEMIKIGELGEQRREIVAVGEFDANDYYIGLEHVPRRHVWLSSWTDASGLESSKGRFKEGDILFGKLRPYFHKVGLALVAGVASTDIIVIRPRQEVARGWLLAAASSDDVIDHASAVGDGTRMPRAKWQDIASFEVPWPGYAAVAEFNEFVAVLTERVRASIYENRNLMELRDTLLPGLMSGAFRVREAEKIVEAAT